MPHFCFSITAPPLLPAHTGSSHASRPPTWKAAGAGIADRGGVTAQQALKLTTLCERFPRTQHLPSRSYLPCRTARMPAPLLLPMLLPARGFEHTREPHMPRMQSKNRLCPSLQLYHPGTVQKGPPWFPSHTNSHTHSLHTSRSSFKFSGMFKAAATDQLDFFDSVVHPIVASPIRAPPLLQGGESESSLRAAGKQGALAASSSLP